MVSQTVARPDALARHKQRYFLAWRWHFYAGILVIPFLLMLSVTGLIMLFDDEIESARYSDILQVTPQASMFAPSVQLEAVKQAYPDANVTQFIPAHSADSPHRFSIQLPDETTRFVLVNPYTGEVQGDIDRSESWYALANDIHGTLLIGDLGDYLIEIAASFMVILLISGIYLWLPRDNASRAGFLTIRTQSGTRILMRDLHANIGGVLSIVLLFFVLSGLAWAGIWGGKLVQPWSSFPAQRSSDVPTSNLNHKALNHGVEEEMPWNLELSPVPASKVHQHGEESDVAGNYSSYGVGIDALVSQAEAMGFTQYKLRFPRSETGVFTLSANTMSGDITDPRQDRTVHIDQYSGEVLADITWQDYGVLAKAMAAGIALHQGDISVINKIFNTLFCLAFIAISVTGFVMWWMRRPSGQRRLVAPPKMPATGVWQTGLVSVVFVSVMFPLAGGTIAFILAADWIVFSRIERLKQAVN